MSEVKLVIREAQVDRSGKVHGLVADWFVAALSADPESVAELDAAVDRFALETPERGHLANFSHWLDTAPWDAGLVVIDLAARLVVVNSSYSSPGREGAVVRHNVPDVPRGSISLKYQLADEWLMLYDESNWEVTASIRRQQRAEQPVVDLREIFYGEPLLRFIVRGCRKQFAQRDAIARQVHLEWVERRRQWNERYAEEAQPDPESLTMHELCRASDPQQDIEYDIYYDTIRDIHAAWLMTPCTELNNELPRKVLLRDRDRLSGDMENREFQWQMLEKCPPGISPESHAFQFSGFNTNEIVLYYDYVREVAWNCWNRLRTMSAEELATLETSPDKLERFIGDEVSRLKTVGEAWLDSPWEDDPRRTPRGIINLERQRLPNGGQFHPIDPDCPCCQALAEMPGIGFWSLDGCNMDNLFAFCYHYDTLEEWEQAQEEYKIFDEQLEQKRKLAKEWNLVPEFSEPGPESDDIWRLVVKADNGEIPLGKRLNAVGHEVVSVIVQLRSAAEHQPNFAADRYCEMLQFAFAQLRQACEASNAEALSLEVEPSLERLLRSLDELLSEAKGYAGEDAEDADDAEAAGGTVEPETADASGSSVDQPTTRAYCWGRLLHFGQTLEHRLRKFKELREVTTVGEWDDEDTPF